MTHPAAPVSTHAMVLTASYVAPTHFSSTQNGTPLQIPSTPATFAATNTLSCESIQCRPRHVGDYERRLATFTCAKWFDKPESLSPIECARIGFINSGIDTLICETCGSVFKWSKEASIYFDKEDLRLLHHSFCPWRCVVVHLDSIGLAGVATTTAALIQDYENRLQKLRDALNEVPLVKVSKLLQDALTENDRGFPMVLSPSNTTYSSNAERIFNLDPPIASKRLKALTDSSGYLEVFKILSLYGWNYVGDIQSANGDTVQLLRCIKCLRQISSDTFSRVYFEKDGAFIKVPGGAQVHMSVINSRTLAKTLDDHTLNDASSTSMTQPLNTSLTTPSPSSVCEDTTHTKEVRIDDPLEDRWSWTKYVRRNRLLEETPSQRRSRLLFAANLKSGTSDATDAAASFIEVSKAPKMQSKRPKYRHTYTDRESHGIGVSSVAPATSVVPSSRNEYEGAGSGASVDPGSSSLCYSSQSRGIPPSLDTLDAASPPLSYEAVCAIIEQFLKTCMHTTTAPRFQHLPVIVRVMQRRPTPGRGESDGLPLSSDASDRLNCDNVIDYKVLMTCSNILKVKFFDPLLSHRFYCPFVSMRCYQSKSLLLLLAEALLQKRHPRRPC